MKPERVLVIGAGIGGMAMAAALGRLGLPCRVLEQADAIGEVGSGLGVLPSAVRALRVLGVPESVLAENGAPFDQFFLRSANGDELAQVSFRRLAATVGADGYCMARTALHGALVDRVDPDDIVPKAKVVALEPVRGGVRVHLAGRSEPMEADLVVGADGLRSVARDFVLGDGPPRYAGETIFRGIADLTLDEPGTSVEFFGRGQRTAHYRLAPGRVYWWATAPLPEGSKVPQAERRRFVQTSFAGWPAVQTAVFARTPTEGILQNDVFDRAPAPRWHRDRVVLVGDAAHPTTPNLGQGACMAIEDAVVLARAIRSASSADEAFACYFAQRSRRTARIVRQSRLWGRLGLWRSKPFVGLRNRMIRLTPNRWIQGIAAEQYAYDPGDLGIPATPRSAGGRVKRSSRRGR